MSPISHSCRIDLLTLGVTGAAFKIAGEMHWLVACFDNPDVGENFTTKQRLVRVILKLHSS